MEAAAANEVTPTAFAGRREEILTVAARIFSEKGYAATTVQDVADAVGVLKGSLYYYIDSKQDLLAEIVWEVHEGGMQRAALLSDVHVTDFRAELYELVRAHVAGMLADVVKVRVFFQDFNSLSEDRRERILHARDSYDRRLRDLISRGQTDGSFRDDLDPKLVSMGLLGMMNWVYQWYRDDGERSVEEIAATLAELAVSSVAVTSR